MSDTSQGPGWWLASDGKWYPPQQGAAAMQPPPPAPPAGPPPGSQMYATPPVPPPPMYYAAPQAMQAPMRQNGNALAYAALGLGGASALFTLFCWFFGLPFGIGAIACGVIALKKNKEVGETSTNWAAWLGMAFFALSIVASIVLFVLVVASSSSSTAY
jgi:hypothetical protein